MSPKPGAGSQINRLVFGLTYRPAPEANGQVHRFLAEKAAEINKAGKPNLGNLPRRPDQLP